MQRVINFVLNGRPVSVNTDEERSLLWTLRTDFALTGTKYGCGEGHCGACTTLVSGKARRSCLTPIKQIEGKEVVTIEGLASSGVMHPLQQAFIDHGAFQCGFCTPGMLLSAVSLLNEMPHPSHDTVIARMEHNLCRCGAHRRIVAAIESVARVTDAQT